MYLPWEKYSEKEAIKKNTLQIFITNRCNLNCDGCFARNIMKKNNTDMDLEEYKTVIQDFIKKGGQQINIIGGEPLLHPELKKFLNINRENKIKTTIYTNGYFLHKFKKEDFENIKLRVSLYCKSGKIKSLDNLSKFNIPIDICFMVSKYTTVDNLLKSAHDLENNYNCSVFFISSIRELDNPNKEFFEDTDITMNLIDYKKLVHEFLKKYQGNMEIHISKRGMFESTKTPAENRCRFANYFANKLIIQCPYDVVNSKFQKDYSFEKRYCQHNSTCLMSKIILVPKK